MEPTTSQRLADLLEVIRQTAGASNSLHALQERIVNAISRELPAYDWVGFYMLDPDDSTVLVLGPYVGEATPHVRIPIQEGICGAAAASGSTIVVDDVNADPRYLSCSIKTRSEIVVPIFAFGAVAGELDIDSHTAAAFGESDRTFLEEVARIVGAFIEAVAAAGSAARLVG